MATRRRATPKRPIRTGEKFDPKVHTERRTRPPKSMHSELYHEGPGGIMQFGAKSVPKGMRARAYYELTPEQVRQWQERNRAARGKAEISVWNNSDFHVRVNPKTGKLASKYMATSTRSTEHKYSKPTRRKRRN